MLTRMNPLIWTCLVLGACGGGSKSATEPKAPVANDSKAQDPAPAPSSDPAETARADAERAAANADEAHKRVESLQAEASELDAKVKVSLDAVVSAQNDGDRTAAKAKLDSLRKQKSELDARLALAKSEAKRAERGKGVKVSPACIDNPLAEGCN